MPFVTVETNLSSSQLPEDFGQRFSEFLADLFTKPLPVLEYFIYYALST